MSVQAFKSLEHKPEPKKERSPKRLSQNMSFNIRLPHTINMDQQTLPSATSMVALQASHPERPAVFHRMKKLDSGQSLIKDKYIHKLQGMDFGGVLGVVFFFLISGYRCDKLEEENPVPIPYSFSYTAGRMPGHTDRVHAETSDGTGVIRGMFSYIDPRYKIRTVEYVADQNGFHPVLITNPVSDTNAVAKAKEKHQTLYNQIASEHQQIALERGQTGEEDEGQYNEGLYAPNPNVVVDHPRDTPTVEHAKNKHFNLYQKIADEHARIAEERKLGTPEGVVINYRY